MPMPATKIASDIFDTARIPDLSALKITSDTLSAGRIPDLSALKITSDTLSAEAKRPFRGGPHVK